jgi:HTH-type transcriptional regulator, transcriptional repressor of NAD biosynthesis genes
MGKRKIGMYGGKFIPVHMGHVHAMIKASTMVEELHVIISYDEEYEAAHYYHDSPMSPISYKMRLRWWKQITKDLPHVYVHAIYDPQTGQFSDWELGAEKIKAVIGKPIDTVFSSENAYEEYFEKLYPEAEHIIIDSARKVYPISATTIRTEGPLKHWEMLPKIVQPYFVKKVVVVGTESCGKSTLVKNLAALYNTAHVEEWGRMYYERLGTYETLESDFPEIAFEHQYQIKEQLKKANKLLFIDTEALVTQFFSIAYEGKTQPVLTEIAKLQQFDLWLFLEPDVDWVDDGTRVFGEENVRQANNRILKSLLEEAGIHTISITGNYQERLEKAMEEVNKLLGVNDL